MVPPEDGNGGRATLRDVAARAGVSVITASRALSGKRRVRRDLVERVRSAAAVVGYQPNHAARSLRTSRTMDLGLVFTSLDTPAALDLIDGLGAGAHEGGYNLLVTSSRGDPERHRDALRHMLQRRVDGLLISRPQGIGEELAEFERQGTPVLALIAKGEGADHLPLVNVDLVPAFNDAFRCLLRYGHRAIALLTEGYGLGPPRPRELRDGALMRVEHLEGNASPADIAVALRAQREADPPATALICDQRFMPAVIEVLRSWELEFPRHISLASYLDSRWLDELMTPPLAAVHIDVAELGVAAARMMTDWLGGQPPPDLTRLPIARWIERPSVGPAPTH
ncbi:MAG: LacI family DNA-binding transcriptional regulator [Dehalococcoidia bacterium]|nr:LacI family DNA-binding transcriptional regulator [Dehalococcoidia bacterium]